MLERKSKQNKVLTTDEKVKMIIESEITVTSAELKGQNRFELFQPLSRAVPFIPIIKAATPVEFGQFDNYRFLIKREDKTDTTIYGGNKVRNLEFILADAVMHNRKSVVTPIPVGSNFSAAFAAHALNSGLQPILCQAELALHPQISDHHTFCEKLPAKLITRRGPLKFILQAMDVAASKICDHSMFVPPGGSNTIGALGHVKAFLELADNIHSGKTPCPSTIFVGAGTGGTSAGILAGIHLTGLPIRLIAIRCASKIICSRYRIKSLANETLKFLGSKDCVSENNFDLMQCPGNPRYGEPIKNFDDIFINFFEQNRIELDRTYTSKVVHAMISYMKNQRLNGKDVLYWHTFSAMASNERRRKGFN